jgi:HSP20 family molecular chaperone IbpA
MVIAAPETQTKSAYVVSASNEVGEKRVLLQGISWEAYLQILDALPQTRGARLTYDDGVLEITVPPETHEFSRCLIV